MDIVGNQENVHCSWLLFKEDFLSQQYFGENQAASIITEAVHFGEGMHRRAFRTKLQAGQVLQLEPGNTCVLKVHNSISYGTKNNQELVQKNFDLAVEVRPMSLMCPYLCPCITETLATTDSTFTIPISAISVMLFFCFVCMVWMIVVT